ncbi:MAG: hypothetical protein IJG24_01540 [Selenomonadaceae bacterium]|nr:hypothetical protein [Selenomonadaceae bacterium]
MTDEQRELERKYELNICQLNMLIEFEKQHVPHDLDTPSIPQMLESARDAFMEMHVDWRAHIGDPILDKREVVSRLLLRLAADVASGKTEL